jgi:hypothetical protein
MFGRLKKAWQDIVATGRAVPVYVVYMPRPDTYAAFVLHEEASDPKIHNTLAHRENNHPTRHYTGTVQAGSFNFLRVEAADALKAVDAAKAKGLRHEPIKTVLSRYVTQNREKADAAEKTAAEMKPVMDAMRELGEMVDRMGGKGPKNPGL